MTSTEEKRVKDIDVKLSIFNDDGSDFMIFYWNKILNLKKIGRTWVK